MSVLATTLRAVLAIALLACILPDAARAQGGSVGGSEGGSQGGSQGGSGPHLKEVQIEARSFLVGQPTPKWVEHVAIPETDAKRPVVLRLIDTQYLIGQTPSVYVRRATAINDAASLTRAGQVLIAFVPEYHLVRLHAVRVLRGAEVLDRTTSASIRFLQRETGLERGVYSGEVTAAILVNDLRVGDTLEVAYTREGQNPVFGSKFIDFAAWDHSYPSLHRRVSLSFPADRPIAWKVLGGRTSQSKPLKPTESAHAGMRRLVFEEHSLSEVQPEPLTPPEHNPYRSLQFSEFSGWEDVVAWAEELFRSEENADDEALRTLVAKLRGKATDEERVAAALELLQSEIRYFSVSLGESSHRPAAPSVVLKRRYGDCKDKSLLLMALLRALGIESEAVLLAIGYPRGLDKALPSPQLFNHVIVRVRLNGRSYYLDPTRIGQHGGLSRMGQAHAHAQALPVAPGSRLVTIPARQGREPANEVIERARVPSFTKDGELEVSQTVRGVAAENLRIMYRNVPHGQIWKAAVAAMEQRYPRARLVGEPRIDDDRESNTFSVSATYAIPKMATESFGNWFIRYSPTNIRGTLAPPPPAARATPLLLPSFPYRATYTFEIELPKAVRVITDPRATTIKSKHFTYTQRDRFRGNVAKTTIELRVAASQVAPPDLQKYGDDVRAINKARPGLIFIPKAAVKTGRAAKKDFSDVLRERLQDAITKTTQAIKSGKLGDADRAAAYCLRSASRADLGAIPRSLADAEAALKLAPQALNILHCNGSAHFAAGNFEQSIAFYAKGITLGPDDETFYGRGIARLYAGRLEGAAEDFAKASELSNKEARPYRDLWLAWTLRRLGRPLPDDLAERAAAQPRGAWPGPALAVLADKLKPAELVRLIERKTGDEGRMAASEGYFYLGQYFLARGETVKARDFFAKARQANVLMYIEHRAAEFELRKLPAAPADAAEPKAKRTKPAATKRTRRPAAAKRAPPERDWRDEVFAR